MSFEFRELKSGEASSRWLAEENATGTYSLGAFLGDTLRAQATLLLRRVRAGGKERRFGEVCFHAERIWNERCGIREGARGPQPMTPAESVLVADVVQEGAFDDLVLVLFVQDQIKGESSAEYREVIQSAKAKTAEALEKTRIPKDMADYVREYIDSLTPDRQ